MRPRKLSARPWPFAKAEATNYAGRQVGQYVGCRSESCAPVERTGYVANVRCRHAPCHRCARGAATRQASELFAVCGAHLLRPDQEPTSSAQHPENWSAEDYRCGRLFFPAKLSSNLEPKVARTLTAAVNSHRVASDAFVEIDAVVRIALYPDQSGGDLTVLAVRNPSTK